MKTPFRRPFWAAVVAALVSSVLAPAAPVSAADKLATPVVSHVKFFQDTIRFTWGAVPDRAEYHWAVISPDGGIVRGGTTDTTHVIDVGPQRGDHCIEVRAVLGGRDSDLSERACIATPSQWPSPVWQNGLSVYSDQAHANFKVVAGTVRYEAEFRLDGDVVATEPLTTRSAGVATISTGTDGRAGEWCGRVRALGAGDIGSSAWTTLDCETVVAPRMATPTLNSYVYRAFPVANPSHVYLYWANDATASGYELEWYHNGTHIGTTTRPDWATWGGRSLAGLVGQVCGRVRSLSTTQLPSVWTANQCIDHQPRLKTPLVSSARVRGDDVEFEWDPVPDRAEYHWAVIEPDGHTVRGATTSTTLATAHGGRAGDWCIEVIAVRAGRDSAVSERICTVVAAPAAPAPQLPTPAPVALSAPGDWVSTNWPAVAGATSYTVRWYRGGSLESEPTRTSRYSSLAVADGGTVCARVRANGATSAQNSLWSAQRCLTFSRLASPSPSAPAIEGDTVIFSQWAPVSKAVGYETRWTRDGVTLSDRAVSNPRSARVRMTNEYGEFCLTVSAIGINNDGNSAPTTACTTFTPLSKPVLLTPTGFAHDIGFAWRSVPGAQKYAVTVRRGTEPPATFETMQSSATAIRPDSTDRVCIDVVALADGVRSAVSTVCRAGEIRGSITGGLANFNGSVRSPLAGIDVCATPISIGGPETCTTSDASGAFTLHNLRQGNYTIRLVDPSSIYVPKCVGTGGIECSVAASPIIGVASTTPVRLSNNIGMARRETATPSIPAPTPEPQPVADLNPPYWTSLAWINTGEATRAQGASTWDLEVFWKGSWDVLGNNGDGEEPNFDYRFEVHANGHLRGTTSSRSYNITGLPVGSQSTVGIRIVDQAGNKSRMLELRLVEPDWSQIFPSAGTASVAQTGSTDTVPAPTPPPNPTPPSNPTATVFGVSQPVGGVTPVHQSIHTCPRLLDLEHTAVYWNAVKVQFFNGSERPLPDGEWRWERRSTDGARWERMDTVADKANGSTIQLFARDARPWVTERYRLVMASRNAEGTGQVCAQYDIATPIGVRPVSGEEVCATWESGPFDGGAIDAQRCVTYLNRYDTDEYLMSQLLADLKATVSRGDTASQVTCTGLGFKFPVASIVCLGESLVGARGLLRDRRVIARLQPEAGDRCLRKAGELNSSDRNPARPDEDEDDTFERLNPICDASIGPSGFPTSLQTWLYLTHCQQFPGDVIRDGDDELIVRCPSLGQRPLIVFPNE